jgi:hypothetical protein
MTKCEACISLSCPIKKWINYPTVTKCPHFETVDVTDLTKSIREAKMQKYLTMLDEYEPSDDLTVLKQIRQLEKELKIKNPSSVELEKELVEFKLKGNKN